MLIVPVTGTKAGWTEIKSLLCPTPRSDQGLRWHPCICQAQCPAPCFQSLSHLSISSLLSLCPPGELPPLATAAVARSQTEAGWGREASMDSGGVIAPITGTKTRWTEIKSLLCPTPQSAQALAPTYLSDQCLVLQCPPGRWLF